MPGSAKSKTGHVPSLYTKHSHTYNITIHYYSAVLLY